VSRSNALEVSRLRSGAPATRRLNGSRSPSEGLRTASDRRRILAGRQIGGHACFHGRRYVRFVHISVDGEDVRGDILVSSCLPVRRFAGPVRQLSVYDEYVRHDAGVRVAFVLVVVGLANKHLQFAFHETRRRDAHGSVNLREGHVNGFARSVVGSVVWHGRE
jgi:hypothetical protein